MDQEPPTNKLTNQSPRYSRRAFLQGLLATSGMAALAACAPGVPRNSRPRVDDVATATRARALSSPVARPAEGTPQPGATEGLEQFLLLSSVLTGVANLDPVVGSVYLQALQQGDFEASLEELYEMASLDPQAEQDISDLEQAGLFDEESTSTLADTIIRYWYTGVYDTADGEQAVATYVDALAWKALPWTKPNSICASFGFWEERPRAVNLEPGWVYEGA